MDNRCVNCRASFPNRKLFLKHSVVCDQLKELQVIGEMEEDKSIAAIMKDVDTQFEAHTKSNLKMVDEAVDVVNDELRAPKKSVAVHLDKHITDSRTCMEDDDVLIMIDVEVVNQGNRNDKSVRDVNDQQESSPEETTTVKSVPKRTLSMINSFVKETKFVGKKKAKIDSVISDKWDKSDKLDLKDKHYSKETTERSHCQAFIVQSNSTDVGTSGSTKDVVSSSADDNTMHPLLGQDNMESARKKIKNILIEKIAPKANGDNGSKVVSTDLTLIERRNILTKNQPSNMEHTEQKRAKDIGTVSQEIASIKHLKSSHAPNRDVTDLTADGKHSKRKGDNAGRKIACLYECKLCPLKFKWISRLTRHVQRDHTNLEAGKVNANCPICKTNLSSRLELESHMKEHLHSHASTDIHSNDTKKTPKRYNHLKRRNAPNDVTSDITTSPYRQMTSNDYVPAFDPKLVVQYLKNNLQFLQNSPLQAKWTSQNEVSRSGIVPRGFYSRSDVTSPYHVTSIGPISAHSLSPPESRDLSQTSPPMRETKMGQCDMTSFRSKLTNVYESKPLDLSMKSVRSDCGVLDLSIKTDKCKKPHKDKQQLNSSKVFSPEQVEHNNLHVDTSGNQ